jgi:hypothetical protein
MPVVLKDFSWDRMIAAVDAVRERARRASAALSQNSLPHSIIGGHAVASWVARIDVEAVHNTADVDLLIRREPEPLKPRLKELLESPDRERSH